MTQDGHNTFSPDRRWLLNDTYPDKQNFRTLYLYDLQQGTRHDLAKLLAQPEDFPNPCRCDFHPRFSRDGQRVSIDSMHEGVRAMYELDVSGVVNA
jgi:Tol biopolymer transport system component